MCISTSKRTVAMALVLLLGAVVLFSLQVFASPPAPDGWIFEQYGLSYDESSLISYLQNGLPRELVDKDGQKMTDYRRWTTFYPEVVRLLAKAKSEAAVPVLCDILTAMPPVLTEELDASDNFSHGRERDIAYLQMFCAQALGEIGVNSAVPVLSGFARRILPELKTSIETEYYQYCTSAFNFACRSLGLLGEKEGVALLMAALPDTPDKDLWVIISLQVLTGVTFSPKYGPDYGHPTRVVRALRDKWLTWWKENRATYQADPEAIRERNSRYKPRPPMETIRDYVHEAPFRGITDGPMERGEEAAAWLEKNGPKRLDDLAALMNDPDESIGIRREAMAWYAKFGGRKAIKEITRYVHNQVPFDPEDADLRDQMARAAFEIIRKNDLKQAYKLAKESLKDTQRIPPAWALNAINEHDPQEGYRLAAENFLLPDRGLALASVVILMNHLEGIQLVTENYDKLSPDVQAYAIQHFPSYNKPEIKAFIAKALKSEDIGLRRTAEFVVKSHRLESLLDE